jgi:hypothetical protein
MVIRVSASVPGTDVIELNGARIRVLRREQVMTSKKVLLGTTALLGAGVMMASDLATAADLAVTINGFSRVDAAAGDLDAVSPNADGDNGNPNRRSFDQQTDSEVHVNVNATDEETGIEYGGRVEFEADTSSTNNTDEMWTFVKGGFGEFRFGDEDGPTDNMRLGGQSIAAGTGGIDGADSVIAIPNQTINSGDATKIIYYSPVLSGFQLGGSFANGSDNGKTFSASNDGALHQWIEGGLTYDGSFGAVDLRLSATANTAQGSGNGQDDYWGGNLGTIVGIAGIDFAAGYYHADDSPADGSYDGWTAGVAAALGPANVSVTGGQAIGLDGADPKSVVLSADMGLLPGLALQGDLNFFDRDTGGSDDGVTGVVRLALNY